MIPKIIHYCWFGKDEKPKLAKKCIASWKKYCPDYQIIEWNEDNYDISSAPLFVRQAIEAQKWAFASENQNPNFTVNIDLPATVHTSTLVDGKIAPGTSGSFDIELSNLQSEVGVDFTIAFTGTSKTHRYNLC